MRMRLTDNRVGIGLFICTCVYMHIGRRFDQHLSPPLDQLYAPPINFFYYQSPSSLVRALRSIKPHKLFLLSKSIFSRSSPPYSLQHSFPPPDQLYALPINFFIISKSILSRSSPLLDQLMRPPSPAQHSFQRSPLHST
jgi:hypothetical protein